jgi:hypothetical protein
VSRSRLLRSFIIATWVTWAAICLAAGCLATAPAARADNVLPYANRTRGYSGLGSTVSGDIRTLGMAGAMVGLADTFTAAGDNPAGLAMTLESTGAQLVGNRIQDGHLQSFNEPVETLNLGAVASAYPWGFSLGYWIPHQEGAIYRVGAQDINARMAVRELRLSAARFFRGSRLSLGVSLIFGHSLLSEEVVDAPQVNPVDHTFALGAAAGLMYRLPHRWVLGASYTLPMIYRPNSATPSAGITDFFQPIHMPWRLNLGAGWFPSRFVHVGVGAYVLGPIPDSALLSDDSATVGESLNVQPRVGVGYRLAEFSELKAYLYGGTYYEFSRIEGRPGRLHGTLGFEVNAWVFNLGWALDEAKSYQNFISSIGVDVIRILRKIDVVPDDYQPKPAGFLPDPRVFSDDGLPRPLVTRWRKRQGDQGDIKDVIQIGKQIPKKLGERLEEAVDAIDPNRPKPLGPTEPDDADEE